MDTLRSVARTVCLIFMQSEGHFHLLPQEILVMIALHLNAVDLAAFRSVCRAFRNAVSDTMYVKAAYNRIFKELRFSAKTMDHPMFLRCAEYGRSMRYGDAAIAWHALTFVPRRHRQDILPFLIERCLRNHVNGAQDLLAYISIDCEIRPSSENTLATIGTFEICGALLHSNTIVRHLNMFKDSYTLGEIFGAVALRRKCAFWLVLSTVRQTTCPNGQSCVCNAIFVAFSTDELLQRAASAEGDGVHFASFGWRGPAPTERVYTTLEEWQQDRALHVQAGILRALVE